VGGLNGSCMTGSGAANGADTSTFALTGPPAGVVTATTTFAFVAPPGVVGAPGIPVGTVTINCAILLTLLTAPGTPSKVTVLLLKSGSKLLPLMVRGVST